MEARKFYKQIVPTEREEQIPFVKYLRLKKIPFYHTPNGEKRPLGAGYNLKCMGVSPGVPDICIPVPKGKYHGLYIELKRIKGSCLRDEQKFWLGLLNEQGYYAVMCKGWEAAVKVVEFYMSL